MIKRFVFFTPLNLALAVAAIASLAFASQALAANVPKEGAAAVPASAEVRSLCPGVDAALQSSLASAWWRHGLPGTLRVQMKLEGRQVSDARLVDGPRQYRVDVQRALRNLDCDAGAGVARTLNFEIHFADEAQVPAPLVLADAAGQGGATR